MADARRSETVGCTFCGGRPAGVYYGHNTGRPFKVCADRLLSIKRHGLFQWSADASSQAAP